MPFSLKVSERPVNPVRYTLLVKKATLTNLLKISPILLEPELPVRLLWEQGTVILKSPLFNGKNLKGMLSRSLFILVAFLNHSEVLIKGLIIAFLASSLDLFLPVSWILSFPRSQSFLSFFFFFSFSFSIVFHLSRLELRNNLLFLNSDISVSL